MILRSFKREAKLKKMEKEFQNKVNLIEDAKELKNMQLSLEKVLNSKINSKMNKFSLNKAIDGLINSFGDYALLAAVVLPGMVSVGTGMLANAMDASTTVSIVAAGTAFLASLGYVFTMDQRDFAKFEAAERKVKRKNQDIVRKIEILSDRMEQLKQEPEMAR